MDRESGVIVLHKNDNVVISLEDLSPGTEIQVDKEIVTVSEPIPKGHKVALTDLPSGVDVVKYGFPIGHTTAAVARGQWLHTHNMKTNLAGKSEYAFSPTSTLDAADMNESLPTEFLGYVRENGDVGIRNEVWIINTVGCINKTAERLAQLADVKYAGHGVDGVFHFAHPYGCSQLGDDLTYTQALLAALVHHPNAGAVLVLGLGCENNRISDFAPIVGDTSNRRVKYLSVQEVANEWEAGMANIDELVQYAQTFQRQPVPISKLKVGLKCGGSDGFSGITANPLVGQLSNHVIQHGGTTLLTEVPEMFGAETILMNRAKDQHTFSQLVDLINDFKDYYSRHNQPIYENPSPGNKDGGITTLEEKSLGCTQKGGRGTVVDVLGYAQPAHLTGLNIVSAPGNDMVSVTALVAAGAHVILFTTGRGTPMGAAVPTLKISTNSDLYVKKKHWIDFDAGQLLAGESMAALSAKLYERVIEVASGQRSTRNEENGFREIAIFKDGVTL